MTTQVSPQRTDYASFAEFEQALIKWRTPAVVEEVAEQYQILAYRDGTFSANVWHWATSDLGYWTVANTCHRLDRSDVVKKNVLALHVPSIYRPTAFAPSTIPDGYAVTSTGETVLIDDWDEIEGNM